MVPKMIVIEIWSGLSGMGCQPFGSMMGICFAATRRRFASPTAHSFGGPGQIYYSGSLVCRNAVKNKVLPIIVCDDVFDQLVEPDVLGTNRHVERQPNPTWTAGRDFAIENGRNAGG
jgi:hypothetical protein